MIAQTEIRIAPSAMTTGACTRISWIGGIVLEQSFFDIYRPEHKRIEFAQSTVNCREDDAGATAKTAEDPVAFATDDVAYP